MGALQLGQAEVVKHHHRPLAVPIEIHKVWHLLWVALLRSVKLANLQVKRQPGRSYFGKSSLPVLKAYSNSTTSLSKRFVVRFGHTR